MRRTTGPDTDPGQIIVACPNVTVDKTPDGGLAGTINAGDAAVFTIVISNTGLGTATGVTLKDDLPNDGNITWSLTSATKNPPPAVARTWLGLNAGPGGSLPTATSSTAPSATWHPVRPSPWW